MASTSATTTLPDCSNRRQVNAGIDNIDSGTTRVNVDLGYRFKRAAVQGSVAAYSAKFDDRQLSVATCAGILGCPSTFVNVGKVDTRGVEAIAAMVNPRIQQQKIGRAHV